MFSFVEDPLLSFEGYLLYSVPWILQEPKEHPKTKETVLFHKSFGGEKRTSWSFYSFLWFCCCGIAVETGAAVWSWLTFAPRIPLLIQIFQSSWWSTLRFQSYKVSFVHCTCTYAQQLSQSTSTLLGQLGLLAFAIHPCPSMLKDLMWNPYLSLDFPYELPFADLVCLFFFWPEDVSWDHSKLSERFKWCCRKRSDFSFSFVSRCVPLPFFK